MKKIFFLIICAIFFVIGCTEEKGCQTILDMNGVWSGSFESIYSKDDIGGELVMRIDSINKDSCTIYGYMQPKNSCNDGEEAQSITGNVSDNKVEILFVGEGGASRVTFTLTYENFIFSGKYSGGCTPYDEGQVTLEKSMDGKIPEGYAFPGETETGTKNDQEQKETDPPVDFETATYPDVSYEDEELPDTTATDGDESVDPDIPIVDEMPEPEEPDEDPVDLSCLEQSCYRHSDCKCDADVCIPGLASSVIKNTNECTTRGCETDDDCPQGYECGDTSGYASYVDGAQSICAIPR